VKVHRPTHLIVFGERHLFHVLKLYQRYYNESRTQLSLDKDVPISRTVETTGRIVSLPVLGGRTVGTHGFNYDRDRWKQIFPT